VDNFLVFNLIQKDFLSKLIILLGYPQIREGKGVKGDFCASMNFFAQCTKPWVVLPLRDASMREEAMKTLCARES